MHGRLGIGPCNPGSTVSEMRRMITRVIAGSAAILFAPAARAADNFSVSVTANGTTAGQTSSANLDFTSVTSVIDEFKNSHLSATLPTYTDTSIANAVINYRGVTAT